MHLHLLRVFLVASLVMPCTGNALKEEDTRKGKRTEVGRDSLEGGEEGGEAVDDSVLKISDDKNDESETWNPSESQKESGNEKRETRKGKRTREEQDTGTEADEATSDRFTLSEDKNERSGISHPLEVEEKQNEKRATRKGKRMRVEQDTDTEGDEATGDRFTLSEDKNERSGILYPLEVQEKQNEKRTRKGKRDNI